MTYITIIRGMKYFNHDIKVHEINNISDSLWAFDIIKSV